MAKIGLFYGSDTGTTEEIIKEVKDNFSTNIDIHNISNCSEEDIKSYDKLILASSTWGDGDLQADWEDFEANLANIDFSNKTIALIGLGDQENYSDTFCNALGHFYNYVKDGRIIGQTSTQGYEFEESTAVINDEFIGLVIDDINQEELTKIRIKNWVESIEDKF